MTQSNRINFDMLRSYKDDQLALMSPEEFLLLQQDLDERKESIGADKKLLDSALNRRFSNLATFAYKAAQKDTGTVDLLDRDGFLVQCEKAKTVAWDQAELKKLYQKILDAGDDPKVFIQYNVAVSYTVSENAFKTWPENIQKAFSPARTVKAGPPVYKIKPKKD